MVLSVKEMKETLTDHLILNIYTPVTSYAIDDELQMDAKNEFGSTDYFRITPKGEIKVFKHAIWNTIN
ncbi:hypothetical protein [Carnobacterium sp. ISL-102]|uniref:hypothetical protein n=1 Tax=Carnobacterium sp. ISL-102 TaxID=2819142 RepID=UPI001BE7470B|nr:hypothetical protein [Carnobacterium sp. ISL-102]MBT2732094.1 hypothetical protein [Carnobacterium sp. ISL-102]